MAITLTEAAAREIDTIIEQQDLDPAKVCLRVGVKGGGCSGFSYILDLTESTRDTDEMWTFTYQRATKKSKAANEADKNAAVAVAEDESDNEFSIRVVCDPKSYLYLNGATVDFKDEIMQRGFVFNNPNASSSCGCGSSFSA
ncbi:MAG: HesB/IscA family protein [Phycisphaerales bacterium]